MQTAIFQPLSTYKKYSEEEMNQRAISFHNEMQRRRTIRHFSDNPIPRKIIEECLL